MYSNTLFLMSHFYRKLMKYALEERQTMTHRYPTRFQAKQAAEDMKMTESRTTLRQWIGKVAVSGTDIEKANEMRVIKTLLHDADKSYCRFHRITIAIKLFHYFENHHYLLRNYPRFREIARTKIDEFSTIAKYERRIYNGGNCEQYQEQCRIITAIDILMDSCAYVRTLIQNF